MDELINHFGEAWAKAHPALCGWLLVFVLHLYSQTWNLRKVMHMRRGDWLWCWPRGGRWERLLIWLHLAKPVYHRRKSRPPACQRRSLCGRKLSSSFSV